MPTRMIRDAILNSDRFLSLPDNTARVCFIACLLSADDRGNLEGGPGYLVRMWRDFGVDSTEKAASIGQFLADQDLIRFYDAGSKRHIHVPRFQQRMRSFKRACPPSPWCKTSTKSEQSLSDCPQPAASSGKSPPKRSEGKGSTTLAQTSFAQFWEAYPKKKSKGQAEKSWLKLNPDEHLTATILQAVLTAKNSDDWRRDLGKWIPHPASWLNAKGWLDELTPSPSGGLAL